MRPSIAAILSTTLFGATFAIGATLAHAAPRLPLTTWGQEQLVTGPYDSWEPDVAADPSSSYVYVIDNRFGAPTACARCPDPPLIVQASADGGATWGEPVFVCPCRGASYQFDPTIYVTNTGVVYAAWLNGHSTVFSTSSDHGQTWSAPIRLNPNRWTDHPWLGASADGRNIYVFWAQGDAYEVHSHDFGATWSPPQKINTDKSHFYYPNGVAVTPSGTVLMGASSYPCGKGTSICRGAVNITVFRSTNAGASYKQKTIETLSTGVDFATSSLTTLASDAVGDAVIEYTGAATVGANSQVFTRRSTNDGATWGHRVEVGQGPTVNGGFPAIAGSGAGTFVLTYMDDRTGVWNVWSRSSADAGASWDVDARVSNATDGAPYKSADGFANPYGDYDGVAITPSGSAVAVMGEAPSWNGPGGIWANRQT